MGVSIEHRNPVSATTVPERAVWGAVALAGLGALPLTSCCIFRPRPIAAALLTSPETRPMHLRSLALAAFAGLVLPTTAESVRASVTVSGLTCPNCPFIAGRSIDALEGAEVLGDDAALVGAAP